MGKNDIQVIYNMSLLDLRDRHIIPAINDGEMELGHMLHNSLDNDVSHETIKELQRRVGSLIALKEYINQNTHEANSTEYLKQFYDEAQRLGLHAAVYHERRPVTANVEVKKTAYQASRSRKRSGAKGAAKPVAEVEPEMKTSVPAPIKAKVPAKVKIPAKVKAKVKATVKATAAEASALTAPEKKTRIGQYMWKTGSQAKAGSGLYFKYDAFRRRSKGASDEHLDMAMNAMLQGSRPIPDQVSSAAALGGLPDEVVALHNRLKSVVYDTKP